MLPLRCGDAVGVDDGAFFPEAAVTHPLSLSQFGYSESKLAADDSADPPAAADAPDDDDDSANKPQYHPLPDGVAPLHIPVVCLAFSAADALRGSIGVSRERRPDALLPDLVNQLLASQGFPTELVAKATARHPDSYLKALNWLRRHRDMLMMQHDLLTDLSADVASAERHSAAAASGLSKGGAVFAAAAAATTTTTTSTGDDDLPRQRAVLSQSRVPSHVPTAELVFTKVPAVRAPALASTGFRLPPSPTGDDVLDSDAFGGGLGMDRGLRHTTAAARVKSTGDAVFTVAATATAAATASTGDDDLPRQRAVLSQSRVPSHVPTPELVFTKVPAVGRASTSFVVDRPPPSPTGDDVFDSDAFDGGLGLGDGMSPLSHYSTQPATGGFSFGLGEPLVAQRGPLGIDDDEEQPVLATKALFSVGGQPSIGLDLGGHGSSLLSAGPAPVKATAAATTVPALKAPAVKASAVKASAERPTASKKATAATAAPAAHGAKTVAITATKKPALKASRVKSAAQPRKSWHDDDDDDEEEEQEEEEEIESGSDLDSSDGEVESKGIDDDEGEDGAAIRKRYPVAKKPARKALSWGVSESKYAGDGDEAESKGEEVLVRVPGKKHGEVSVLTQVRPAVCAGGRVCLRVCLNPSYVVICRCRSRC